MTKPPYGTEPRATTPRRESAALAKASGAPGPYAPPTLVTFGTVAELTATVGRKGRRDGRRSYRRTGF
ncbi:MAG TPA: hypothetical protein VMV51_12370 [Gemmatimonadaceae bacterium]|nr:hypothetical protein [Gemmatimonadaceae bacterium]